MTKRKLTEVGAVFGRLTVLRNEQKGRYAYVVCACECGTIKSIRRSSITSDVRPTRSCGCLAKEIARVNFKADRGSSFESEDAYIAHRKAWLKDYARKYDSRPEQREKRRAQSKSRWDRMTQEKKDRHRELKKLYSSKPERKEKKKASDAAWRSLPENKERIKLKLRKHYEYQRDNLTDAYVADCFIQGASLKPEDIPQEILQAVRLRIQIHRNLKTKHHEKC